MRAADDACYVAKKEGRNRIHVYQPTDGQLAARQAELDWVAGLRHAFPKRMKQFERKIPRLVELHGRVAARPNIKAYLASERRIPFNEDGIFQCYKELDG